MLVALALKHFCVCNSASPAYLAVLSLVTHSAIPRHHSHTHTLSLSSHPAKFPIPFRKRHERRRKLCLYHIPARPDGRTGSVDKVDTEKVQQQGPKDKVGKGALVRDALELDLVLRVRLHAQARREHELADGGAEA